jgi:AraC-like DNA-binding protein
MDPFVDLIRLLRPQCTLWGKTEAAGQWGLGFHKRDDLLFCWLQKGYCLLTRPEVEPVTLRRDDFILIRTTTPFTLTTDPKQEPENSEVLARTSPPGVGNKLGSGHENPVVLRGGKFVFDSANEDLLTGLIPPFVHIEATQSVSWRVRSLLNLNEAESLSPGPGSSFLIARLMEMILVEILRGQTSQAPPEQGTLLAGVADSVTAKAITAIHGDVAHNWTVESLARHCGVSRSGFATRFQDVMGMGPIKYLQRWRMALAKDQLRSGTSSVGEIALKIGFQSSSAFTTAFTRIVGCPPTEFMNDRSSSVRKRLRLGR